MEFERVPRLPAHHLHGATLQDGPRLWTVAAFGDEVSLCSTAGGVSAGQLMSPCVARAVAHELLVVTQILKGFAFDQLCAWLLACTACTSQPN